MKTMKKLATSEEISIKVIPPFDENILNQRDNDYLIMSDVKFGKKYRSHLYTPEYLENSDELIEIQLNKCSNPFCARYGQSQKKYEDIKSKPSRYKIAQSSVDNPSSSIFL